VEAVLLVVSVAVLLTILLWLAFRTPPQDRHIKP
jgi:hypothetical protein